MTLKTRVIPTLLLRDGELVKGERFNSWRRVGSPVSAVRIYDARQVDELIVLDISATPQGRGPDFDLIGSLADECMSPLTIGGGIRTIDDIRTLLAVGADKIAICTAAYERPALIAEAARKFGRQAVVVSIDSRAGRVVTHCGTRPHHLPAVDWARAAEDFGAGEILLNDIDRDGTLGGYSLDLIAAVARAVRIPVIACGGAASGEDMTRAIAVGAHAVAAGALWVFTGTTPLEAKQHMHQSGIAVRL